MGAARLEARGVKRGGEAGVGEGP